MSFLINDKSELIVIEGSDRHQDGNSVVTVKPRYDWVVLTSRMMELRRVLGKMIERMKSNDIINRAAAIGIITFDRFANCFVEFTDLSRISPNASASLETGNDYTNAGRGLQMALDRLDQQMELNSGVGNDSYRPVLIFMSDGHPTDVQEAERLKAEVRRRAERKTLKVIPIGIGLTSGSESDRRAKWLREMTPEGTIYTMNSDSEFESVFDTITSRIRQTTHMIAVDDNDNNIVDDSDDGPASTTYGRDNEADSSSDNSGGTLELLNEFFLS